MIETLNKQRGKEVSYELPPLVQDVDGYKEAAQCLADFKKMKEAYDKAVGKIIADMKEWRGNDPVAKLYARVFSGAAIVDLSVKNAAARDKLLKEAQWRMSNRVPPGYQDAGKEDKGIGDFLIWKSLLELAKARKQDLVFVTGEQKNDWYVQSGGGPIYPRFELVDEYRRTSDGRSLRLMNLHQLLKALKAPTSVIEDAKTAEAQSAKAAERQSFNYNLKLFQDRRHLETFLKLVDTQKSSSVSKLLADNPKILASMRLGILPKLANLQGSLPELAKLQAKAAEAPNLDTEGDEEQEDKSADE